MHPEIKVVIIDDNTIDAFVTERLIRKFAPSVGVVLQYPPQVALQYLRDELAKEAPGTFIVLVDLAMPLMDGWQCINELIKLPGFSRSAFSICILTASINPPDRKRAIELGHNIRYLTKPVSDDDLRAILTPDGPGQPPA